MNSTNVVVWYCDEMGHPTGYEQWSPTEMSFSDGNFWQGEEVDCSDPDKGIFVVGSFASMLRGEEGQVFNCLSKPVMIFSPEQMCRALEVDVAGSCVLVRATVEQQSDFRCGLKWASKPTAELRRPEPLPEEPAATTPWGDEG